MEELVEISVGVGDLTCHVKSQLEYNTYYNESKKSMAEFGFESNRSVVSLRRCQLGDLGVEIIRLQTTLLILHDTASPISEGFLTNGPFLDRP